VVGFDDPSWAALLRPPLTTVAQPTYDLGAETARMLLQRIGGYAGAARELVLSPSLQIRASSLPPHPRVPAQRQLRVVAPQSGSVSPP
jgi:LacI family transcriptional regulator